MIYSMAIINMILMLILLSMFFFISKSEKKEKMKNSTFECGFSSYFYSRFSFSIHYFIIGLIFLFLDLELCLIMPMLSEMESNYKMKSCMMIFVTILVLTLLQEWMEKKLDWKF